MIILHVLNSLMAGGREKIVVDFCNNVDKANNRVVILTLSNNENTLAEQLNNNVELITLPYSNTRGGQFFKLWLLGFFQAIRKIKELKPDIVHNHLYYHHFLFITLCLKFLGFRGGFFRTVHTSGLFYESTTILDKFRLGIEKIASNISKPNLISVSKKIYLNNKKFFEGKYRTNNHIPNGINLKHFSKPSDSKEVRQRLGYATDDVICVYVSRLDRGKNHDILISAWKNVIKAYPKAKLLLLGNGVLFDELDKQIRDLDLKRNVFLIGYTRLVKDYISVADLSVFPSSFEGFPISLLEKMAMSLPIIVSDIDAFKEIIIDNVNGKYFELPNIESLQIQLLDLIRDSEKRSEIGRNARLTALNYDIQTVVIQTLLLYKDSVKVT